MMMAGMVVEAETQTMRSDRLTTLRTTTAALRLIDRMDLDRDQSLSALELGWDDKRLADWDRDGNGKLSAGEWVDALGRSDRPACDFHVSIDLANGASSMTVVNGGDGGGVGDHADDRFDVSRVRDGQFRIATPDRSTQLTLSYRDFDPVAVAVDRAKLTMNELDVNANGFVEADEIVGRFRFESYLFVAMDRNSDDRVSEAEMLDYVRDYVRPAATTCRVTLYDLGRGYFGRIDQSNDGRISIRELRTAEQNLQSFSARDQAEGKMSSEVQAGGGGNFRIEFSRGQMMPFGEIERPETEAPQAILGEPVGPVWFQRMDRNTDGDLTWREFLGPRDVFDAYDADRDGLIDADEATATLD